MLLLEQRDRRHMNKLGSRGKAQVIVEESVGFSQESDADVDGHSVSSGNSLSRASKQNESRSNDPRGLGKRHAV